MDGSERGANTAQLSGKLPEPKSTRAALKKRLETARLRKSHAPTIPQTDRTRPLPLSFAQQRIWFLQELAPGNPFYNIPTAVPMTGQIDQAALEAALNSIVDRHEILRTVYARIDGQPRQIVNPHAPALLEILDLSAQGKMAAERQLDLIATAEAEAPFDLSIGPVIRFRLVRLTPHHHVLLLTVHHIAADGWSMGNFFKELSALYEANRTGSLVALPDLSIQYGDFAQWQRDRLSGQTLDDLLSYWRKQLDGATDLSLIADRPRPAFASFKGGFFDVKIDRATTQAARQLARAHDCTLFQTMLTAFKAVLARFANATDVVIGAPIANRVHPGLEPLIGFFVNSIALRTDLSGNPTFAEMLRRVRVTTLGAYANQDLPFERLVEDLRPDRDLSRNPLFQVSFQIQNAPSIAQQPTVTGQDFRRIERSSAILDLALSLWETPEGLIGGIEYSTDLFDQETVSAIADAFTLTIKAAAADPEIKLSTLPMMSTQAQRANVRKLQGPMPATRPTTLTVLFGETVLAHPTRVALRDSEGTLTFADLDDLVSRLATAFQQAGIAPRDTVGIALNRGRAFVATLLAVNRLGAAYLPLDPETPPSRLRTMAETAAPKMVIVEDDSATYAHGANGRIGDLLAFAATCEPLAEQVQIGPDDPCYILFTSGSTGRPKAVSVSHGALANHMCWMRKAFDVTPDDRILQRTPVHFDASIWEVWLPLVTGAALCLPPPFHAADAQALAAAMEDLQPTIAQYVPSLLPPVLAAGPMVRTRATLRLLCCGGEPLTRVLVKDLQRAFDRTQIVNLYGPTETTIDATWHSVDPDAVGPIPIGHPIDHSTVLVVDDAGNLCPPKMFGELAIGGRLLSNGYLQQDDLNASRFVELPGQRSLFFLSGDVGWYRSDGTLYCVGRKDRQVKLRGNRIELGEIEAVLKDHPLIDQAAVLLMQDDETPTLAAFVTLGSTDGQSEQRYDLENSAVAEWEDLYRVVYAPDATTPDDATDDFTGWTSSFDGQPIPQDQMRRWADEAAARIAALAPRGIFEIGCGSGLLLSRLATDCSRYVGCDLSAPVIDRLRTWVDRHEPGDVSLFVSKAQDADALDIAGCDTLVLNSVVQYLPSASHLTKVLQKNASRMPQDARLFVGDVRPLGLLRAFHAATETAQASDETTAGDLRRSVAIACAQEKELLFDPAYFRLLAEQVLGGDVAIRLKNETERNELFDYRYDVTIRLGAPRPRASLSWCDWRRGEIDLEGVKTGIVQYNRPLAVIGIPNQRVAQAVALSHLIRDQDAGTSRSELIVTADLTAQKGADPGQIAALAKKHGLQTALLPNLQRPDCFDLVVHDGSLDSFSLDASQPGTTPGGIALSTEPTLRALTTRLTPQLREDLSAFLPPVMIPSRFAILDHIPILPNGKLDYSSLAERLPHEPIRSNQFEAPGNALECLIADIFTNVLGVRQVGAQDDFFGTLGGHSLLATQAIAQLREIFGSDLPLRLLFEHPTPAALAAQMTQDSPVAQTIAADFAAMQTLDESALDALLAQSESQTDE